ncbi:MAG: hypothetical protein Q7S05_04220 [bacterium]|nr:hypothetical protein [bacterium]
MVLKRTVDNLKDRPRDERKAVASGIAALIVAILFIGWVVLFFKKIQSTREQTAAVAGSSLRGKVDLSAITEAQQQIINSYNGTAPSQ